MNIKTIVSKFQENQIVKNIK